MHVKVSKIGNTNSHHHKGQIGLLQSKKIWHLTDGSFFLKTENIRSLLTVKRKSKNNPPQLSLCRQHRDTNLGS